MFSINEKSVRTTIILKRDKKVSRNCSLLPLVVIFSMMNNMRGEEHLVVNIFGESSAAGNTEGEKMKICAVIFVEIDYSERLVKN